MFTETGLPLYRRLLDEYRAKRTRAEAGLPPLPAHRGRALDDPGLTMHEVDQAMEAGFGYYEKVRSGRKRPSPERLMDLMRVLGFTPHHARVCYLELFRAEPILPAEPPSAHWETVIAGQREMACVVTPDGRLRAWNEPFAELFANAGVPANWWSWALSGHQAGEILLEWDTQWVPPLMEELRLLHLRHPDESALRDLYARARADRHLLRVAEARSGLNDLARPMRHPKRGPGTARIMAARTGAETIMTVLFEAA